MSWRCRRRRRQGRGSAFRASACSEAAWYRYESVYGLMPVSEYEDRIFAATCASRRDGRRKVELKRSQGQVVRQFVYRSPQAWNEDTLCAFPGKACRSRVEDVVICW